MYASLTCISNNPEGDVLLQIAFRPKKSENNGSVAMILYSAPNSIFISQSSLGAAVVTSNV